VTSVEAVHARAKDELVLLDLRDRQAVNLVVYLPCAHMTLYGER